MEAASVGGLFSSNWPSIFIEQRQFKRLIVSRVYAVDFDLKIILAVSIVPSRVAGRVIGQPEISTDGFHPYRVAIRDAFGASASHGVIVKTYSVTNLNRKPPAATAPPR